MDLVGSVIEWIANDGAGFALSQWPLLMLGLVGLYFLVLIVGYLRVSQVGVQASAVPETAVALPRAPDGVVEAPRGAPYCPVDGLRYPPGARFCARCETDLLVSCANCGATIRAADESCYRCGTREFIETAAAH